jgi:PKD repeat protein
MKKTIFYTCIIAIAMLFRTGQISAQEIPFFLYPADHYIVGNAVATDENLYNAYRAYEEQLKQLRENLNDEMSAKTDTLINGKRIIPVVFHIIHKAGADNISDAQINDAIEKLNIDYNLQNADTANTYHLFKSRAADCSIEFRLAKVDPLGNCTDGINRVFDPGTNYAYFHTMTKYAWSPSMYMNIFVVNFIYPEGMSLPDGAFIGGMSPFPPSNPLSQALTGGDTLADGILIRHDCIGSIETAENMAGMPINQQNRTFTHETGHYFNLYHPFQNLMLGLIPSTNGCHTFLAPNGDEVDDTPQVSTANQNTSLNCIPPGSVNSCSNDPEPDMVENYMDYQFGYCTNIFTQGQYARMETTLMNDRRKLWSYENLVYTGVLDTVVPLCAPVPDFYTTSNMVCAGSSVQFNDYSWSGQADTYAWSFPGGTPATSSDVNPVITYNTPGVYSATLELTNSSGTNSLTKQNLVRVYDQTQSIATPTLESFETININQFVVVNDTGSTWQINAGIGYTGTKSLFLNNFTGNVPGSVTEIITPAYDFTNFSVPPLPALKFRLAYAGKHIPAGLLTPADTAYDHLRVFVSKDCGATWIERYNKKGAALATAAPAQQAFTPASSSDWRQETILLTGGGGYAGEPNVKFRFLFYSNGGNNIYIDDLFIDYTNSNISDPEAFFGVKVFPNPAENKTNVQLSLLTTENVQISVHDLTGRIISTFNVGSLPAGEHNIPIELSTIHRSGLYIINISIGDYQLSKSLSVIR